MKYNLPISAISFLLLSTAGYALTIDGDLAKDIEECLRSGNATTVCSYPLSWRKSSEALHVSHNITWETPATLQLVSKEDIIFERGSFIKSNGKGSLFLKAGMENEYNRDIEIGLTPRGKVIFESSPEPQISIKEGEARVYYNPTPDTIRAKFNHKYNNPQPSYYKQHIHVSDAKNLKSYMMVNDIYDLQDVKLSLSGSYALSQDIEAMETKNWDNKKGFRPIKQERKTPDESSGDERLPPHGFSGEFDGNGYTISNLYIDRPTEDYVGLFGAVIALKNKKSTIHNVNFINSNISGDTYVGGVVGYIQNGNLHNIKIDKSTVNSYDIVGGIAGTGSESDIKDVVVENINVTGLQYKGLLIGGAYNVGINFNFKGVLKDPVIGTELSEVQKSGLHLCFSSEGTQTISNNVNVTLTKECQIAIDLTNPKVGRLLESLNWLIIGSGVFCSK